MAIWSNDNFWGDERSGSLPRFSGFRAGWELFLVFFICKNAGWLSIPWFWVFFPLAFQFVLLALIMFLHRYSSGVARPSFTAEQLEALQKKRLEEVRRQAELYRMEQEQKAVEWQKKEEEAKTKRPVFNVDKLKKR
jgi:hypothetical protein